ncbi:MAG: hypothetical protein IPI07_07380 [Flavobacteriales bacterium]|nr:hypothetical protein [Flavobacteriales bacterium]MBP6699460.1 hypothetical protein [Flavobacteriales bacterium]
MRSPFTAYYLLGLFALLRLTSLSVQAQGTTGVDVFVHFAVPLDGTMEKLTLSTLRAANEPAPLHLGEDHQQAKFTATIEHDFQQLAQAMTTAGIPLVGFHVMWGTAPVFLARSSTAGGPLLCANSGPSAELLAAVKEAWITAFPDLYESLSKGSGPVPAIK